MGFFNRLFGRENRDNSNSERMSSEDSQLGHEYFSNGALKSTYSHSSGVKNGESKEFHSNGQVSRIMTFVNGILQGKVSSYNESGQLKSEHYYVDGKPHGEQKEFFPGGQLRLIHKMNEGEQRGEQLEYYSNGNLSLRMVIIDGEQHGIHEQFFEDGTLDKRAFFWRGKLEGPLEEYDKENKEYNSSIFHFGIDVTTEILGIMIADNAKHMIEAGVLRDGPQNDTVAETNKLMYDYCLKHYLLPNPTIDALKEVLESKRDDEANEALAVFAAMIKDHLELEEAFYEEKRAELLFEEYILSLRAPLAKYDDASSPEEKVAICEEELAKEKVAFRGDWYNRLAYAFIEMSMLKEALEAIENALEHVGSHKGNLPAYKDTKANILMLMGNLSEALVLIDEVLHIDKEIELPRAEHFLTKGKILNELGQTEDCKIYIKFALDLNPEHNEAKKLLASLK